MSIESVMLSNHLILWHPLLLLPSLLPSIRFFPNESSLHIMWPKYWSFSSSISPSNEYSGLISLTGLISLPVQGTQESPPDPKGEQSWVFIGKIDVEAETPILWPPDAKSRLIGKDPDAGKDWRQEREEGDGRRWDGLLASLTQWTWVWVNSGSWWWTGKPDVHSPWGCKESDVIEWLNWIQLKILILTLISILTIGICFPLWDIPVALEENQLITNLKKQKHTGTTLLTLWLLNFINCYFIFISIAAQ